MPHQQATYLSTKRCNFFLRQRAIEQHIQLGRAVLRHARAAQRLVVCQRLQAARAGPIHEPLPTHGQLAVGSKYAMLDAQNSIARGCIVNDDGGARHGNHRHGTGRPNDNDSKTGGDTNSGMLNINNA